MKTKMPKAMYGKSMMKKGGSMKKMQVGGIASKIKTGLDKVVKSTSGPARKAAIANPNTKFPYTSSTGVVYENRKALETGQPSSKLTQEYLKKMGRMKKGGSVKKMQEGGTMTRQQAMADPNITYPYVSPKGALYIDEATMKSGSPANPLNPKNKVYLDKLDKSKLSDAQKTALGIKKKGGAIKKMKTGGMVNPNSSVSKQTVPGSRGVRSGVNPKASSSKVAGSRGSGNANTPPSKAVPTAKRGGAVKKKK